MALETFYSVAWHVSLVAALTWAAIRGGHDERLAVIALAAADVGTLVHHATRHHHRIDAWSALLDGALLLFLTHRAAVSTRWWPLYACAAQVGVCLGLLAAVSQPHLGTRAYKDFGTIFSYGIVLALASGVWLEQGRFTEERDVFSVANTS